MSIFHHHPGPWKAGARTVTAPETEDSLPLDVRIYGGNPKVNRANARLIAAAPKLLALARQYASECGECQGEGLLPYDSCYGRKGDQCPQCEEVRALIVEAAGSHA